jgi:hypothetical protein
MRDLLIAAAALAVAPAAFAQAGSLAPVEETALAEDAFATGLLSRGEGALAPDLWRGADSATLVKLLRAAPARPAGPSIGGTLRRVLLTPGESPPDATPALGGEKLKALARSGFASEARTIESLAAGTRTDPASAEAMAVADLLAGDPEAACDRSRRGDGGARAGEFWVRLRVLCYSRAGELDAAELALGVLRDAGRLTKADETVLVPLAAGVAPNPASEPIGPIHFAAMRANNVALSSDMLAAAEAGVVKAIANDATAGWPLRIGAAKMAAAMGVLSGGELRSLFAAAPDGAHDYVAIAKMTAPELLRDKAARIAAAIRGAGDFSSLYATALLYAEDIRAFEGALLPAGEALSFALARLVLGDAGEAEKWLIAAIPAVQEGGADAGRFSNALGLLALLDRASAERVAATAKVEIPGTPARRPAAATSALSPAIVSAALDAAASGSKGEAALAALSASTAAAAGDATAEVVMMQSFFVAGLGDIARRRAVEEAIAAMFDRNESAEENSMTAASAAEGAADRPIPRLKPKRDS